MKKIILFSALLVLFVANLFAQDKTIDSLKNALKNARHDTTRCNILSAMVEAESNDTIWPKYNNEIIRIAENNIKGHSTNKSKMRIFKLYLSAAVTNIGLLHHYQGDTPEALKYYLESLKISEEIGDKTGIATSLNNIGGVYENQGNIPKALEFHRRSLKIMEDLENKPGIAQSLNNIAIIYHYQQDFAKALEFNNRSLEISKDLGNKQDVALSLNNIAVIYSDQKKEAMSLEYHFKSLKIKEEIGDLRGIAISVNNIGAIYSKQKDFQTATKYFTRSLQIEEELEDKDGIATTLHFMGEMNLAQKNYDIALKYAVRSLKVSKELGFPESIRVSADLLSKVYKAMGKYELALENYELFIQMRDSFHNDINRKASIKSQLKYEYEKKATADSVKVAEEKKIVAVQLKQEKTQRFALYGGLILVLVFAGFMFNRFRVTQKQKNIIELKEKETQQQNEIITTQKHLVEEKHKEITDSINYAERIQRSFLATEKQLNDNLKEYFVLFKPKDVVSGDFYWSAKLNNHNFVLVTADSTGHGVPGAIMSLLNVTSLEKAIEHHTDPADILNHTRQTIIERLKKDGSEDGGKDGMDCSLLSFDFIKNQLHIAAANNPVWIIREKELIEIKPDKMPVGKSERQNESFTLHTIELQKGDTIYALTDGFPDQFGGPKGKKFMSKNLKELLLANVHLPIPQQKELLDSTFKNWVGDLEQVDDVTIIGIRV